MVFFQGTQERVRNSCEKRAISVRATEVLLYVEHFADYGWMDGWTLAGFLHNKFLAKITNKTLKFATSASNLLDSSFGN